MKPRRGFLFCKRVLPVSVFVMMVAALRAASTPSTYVQTDGNCAFPTDLTLEFPTRVEMLHYSSNYSDEAAYALFGFNASDYHQLYVGGYWGRIQARKHTKAYGSVLLRDASESVLPAKETWYNATIVFGEDFVSGDLDGNNVVTTNNTYSINNAPPYILGVNDQLNKKNYQCAASGTRLARCRIFSGADQTHPVRDYYPALGTDGTTACLWEHVTKQRVTNVLTGTPTAEGVAGRYVLDVEASDRAGSVSLDGEGEVVFRDADASVTVTASEDNARRFVRWIGDVSDFADVTAKSVTFTVSGDRKIMALYTGSAYFDVSSGVLRVPDGEWQLKCSVKSSSDRTITLGTGTAGATYLAGSGALDLDVPILGSDGRTWTLVALATDAFSIGTSGEGLGEDGYERMTKLVLPKTLQTIPGRFMSMPYALKDKRRLTNLVMDLPVLDGIQYGGASGWKGFYYGFVVNYGDALTNLVMRLPKEYGNIAPQFFQVTLADGKTTSVDSLVNLRNAYDDWDFSRTQSLQADQRPTFATSTTNMTGGTLRLPSLRSSGALSGNNGGESFRNTNIEHLELGNLAGSLTVFGTAQGDDLCGGSTKLRTIVLSATNDESVAFTICGNSCADSAKSLRAVFLTTDRMPTFLNATPQKPAFGYWDHAALSMCIYVPTNSTAFADILTAAKASADYDASTAAAWAAANNLPVPVGVLQPLSSTEEGAPMLGTTRKQYIGVIDPKRYLANRKAPSVATEAALAALGETVTVSPTCAVSELDLCRSDTRFTVTATCESRVNGSLASTFAGWYINGSHTNLVTANPFSFTPMDDGIESVRPKFVRPWLYDASAGTIWNGDWKLRVQTVSGGLKVAGADANVYGNAFVTAGQGELDLSAPVKDASDNAYQIVSVGARALSRQNKVGGDGPAAIIYPTTLTALEAGSVVAYCADPYSEKLRRVELACPNLAGELPSGLLGAGETALTDLYLNLPGVTALGANPIDAAGTNLVGDVGEWDLSALTAVPAGLFTDQAGLTGTLRLPNVVSLAADALAGSGLEGLELGTAKRLRLGSIGAGACANMSNLKRLEFGPRAQNLTVASDAFDGSSAIKRIEFHARMPVDIAAVANMLSSVPTQDAKQAMVVGSPTYGLEAYLAANPDYTSEEQAAATQLVLREGETLFGVCLNSQRKAWLVGRAPVSGARTGFLMVVK